MVEVVLPSGAFARIRPLRLWDRIVVAREVLASGQPDEFVYRLVARMLTVDEKPVTFEELAQLDLRDYQAVEAAAAKFMTGPVQASGGA